MALVIREINKERPDLFELTERLQYLDSTLYICGEQKNISGCTRMMQAADRIEFQFCQLRTDSPKPHR